MPERPDRNLVLCVCTANVCRSPMAEGLLRHALAAEDAPLSDLEVASAGVAAWAGDPPSDPSVKAMARAGIDISAHRSRPVSPELLDRCLVVLVMTSQHGAIVQSMQDPDGQPPVYLFREFMPAAAGHQVPDPFGAGLETYLETRDALMEAVPSLLDFLRKLVAERAT